MSYCRETLVSTQHSSLWMSSGLEGFVIQHNNSSRIDCKPFLMWNVHAWWEFDVSYCFLWYHNYHNHLICQVKKILNTCNHWIQILSSHCLTVPCKRPIRYAFPLLCEVLLLNRILFCYWWPALAYITINLCHKSFSWIYMDTFYDGYICKFV